MKNLLLLAFSLLATAAFSQATFEMTPDTAIVVVDLELTDVEVHNDMHNLTSTNRMIKWERTIIDINPDTLFVRVCDPDACFAEWIDTHTFVLTPDTTVPIIVHLYKAPDQDADAIVQLKITDLADQNHPQFSYYIFLSAASGTNEQLPAANVKLYPNPVVESFTLDNADEVGRIRVVSTDGREVAAYDASSSQSYSLAGQAPGAYVIVLESKKGRIFQTIPIRKD